MSAAPCADTLTGHDGTARIWLMLLASVGSLVCAGANSGQANQQPAQPEVTVAKMVERRVRD